MVYYFIWFYNIFCMPMDILAPLRSSILMLPLRLKNLCDYIIYAFGYIAFWYRASPSVVRIA